jgi:D-alanyl-D-alanine endopeptidase (penicillin-binding protein 7)
MKSSFRFWSRGLVLVLVMGLFAGMQAPAWAAKKAHRAHHLSTFANKSKNGVKKARHARLGHSVKHRQSHVVRPISMGQQEGLHAEIDPLQLRAGVAFVQDQDTQEILVSKNETAVLPIASVTKLMTGLLTVEAGLAWDEPITISSEDVAPQSGHSRLAVGTTLPRAQVLKLALMSSENRAAHALGRTYPGGMSTFVEKMNQKAQELGMHDTHYVDPTGLSPLNRSSAKDLVALVKVAYQDTTLREFSTATEQQVAVAGRTLDYRTTNGLLRMPEWNIGLQKTGYISAAGQCLVMQAQIAGRKLIMVFLDSFGKYGRFQDAERVRHWLERTQTLPGLGR